MIPKMIEGKVWKWCSAKRVMIWAAIILVVFSLLVLLFPPLEILLTRMAVHNYFVDSLSEKLGWNKYLIQSLVLVCLIPFFYGVRLFFSSPFKQYKDNTSRQENAKIAKRRRNQGEFLLTAMAVAYCLMFYFATKDVAFGFGNRETLKYYARTDKGIVFFDRPGFDPATGQALKPVTPKIVRELDRLREGPLTKVDPATVAWFNPYTGAPELWYYRFPDGQLEFYNRPGANPHTGEALSPVTKDLFMSWRSTNQAQGAKSDARLASFRMALVASSGHGTAGLLTLGDDEAADALARHLQGFNGNALRVDSLRREGFGAQMYAGDTTLLREAMAVTQLDSLVVAQVTVQCEKRSPLDPDLLSCDLSASARKFDSHGNPAGTASAHTVGAGFDRTEAVDMAAERAAGRLNALAAK